MSTKRDRLKRMRDEHKTVVNEETPAEEYVEAAANYHEETVTSAAPKQVKAAKTAASREEPAQTSRLRQQAPEPQPSAAMVSAPVQEIPVMQAQPIAPPVMQQAVTPMASAQRTSAPRTAVPYSVANEPGKRISVSLRTENKNWMHRTALRCGMSIQDYMNILIEEAWNREQTTPYLWNEDEPIPERIPSSKTILVAIKLSNVNIERSQRMRAARCMTMTYYMNYLIEEEIKREQLEGMRRAVFD